MLSEKIKKVMRISRGKVVSIFCCSVLFCILVILLVWQRLLLVEARLILIYQFGRTTMAEHYIGKGNSQLAREILDKSQNVSVNYLCYRKVMFLDASDVVRDYCKTHSETLPPEFKNELTDYSNEVYEKCKMSGAWPNFDNVVDQWWLPKMFYTFTPREPNGEVKRY